MKIKRVTLKGVELQLLPEKALYLPAFKTLCIADWHLGKAAHFRKSGIPLPQPDLALEFNKISILMTKHEVQKIILLGDVFHSSINNDFLLFRKFILNHSTATWILTAGNHDIIDHDHFKLLGIQVVNEYTLGENILCTHAPQETIPDHVLNLAGHVHPGCEIVTSARQRFRLPCFHYSRSVMTLPAFGGLTGLYILQADADNRIFPILGDEVKELKP